MANMLSTGLLELDKILSGEETLRRGELGVFVAPASSIKTDLWRRQLEHAMKSGATAVYIDYEMAKPPDRPIKV